MRFFLRPTGHYLYLETSYPWRAGDKALVSTPVLPRHQNDDSLVCVSFAYDMFGENVGLLNVYVDVHRFRNSSSSSSASGDGSDVTAATGSDGGSSFAARHGLGVGSDKAER